MLEEIDHERNKQERLRNDFSYCSVDVPAEFIEQSSDEERDAEELNNDVEPYQASAFNSRCY